MKKIIGILGLTLMLTTPAYAISLASPISPSLTSHEEFRFDEIRIGDSKQNVLLVCGKPQRIDRDSTMEWWIYQEDKQYMKVGFKQGKVIYLFSPSLGWTKEGISIGIDGEEVKRKVNQNVHYEVPMVWARWELPETVIPLLSSSFYEIHLSYDFHPNRKSLWGMEIRTSDFEDTRTLDLKAKQLLDEINMYRVQQGLSAVTWSDIPLEDTYTLYSYDRSSPMDPFDEIINEDGHHFRLLDSDIQKVHIEFGDEGEITYSF